MKWARLQILDNEVYGVFKEDLFYPQEVSRNDGLESFLNEFYDPKFDDSTVIDTKDARWLPPIARPGKILCIGRNYAEHSREQGKEPESTPLIFTKFSTSMVGHLQYVPFPSHSSAFDYEVELAVIMGKKATRITDDEDPLDYVFGYTVANDLTARDVQKAEKQWTRGKGFDYSLPIGPTIVTKDQFGSPDGHQIWLEVDGERRQESNTSNMIFSVPYLIRYISQAITLEPGDIILTGTPEGVGYYMDPVATLNTGESVVCGVNGLDHLQFTIVE